MESGGNCCAQKQAPSSVSRCLLKLESEDETLVNNSFLYFFVYVALVYGFPLGQAKLQTLTIPSSPPVARYLSMNLSLLTGPWWPFALSSVCLSVVRL